MATRAVILDLDGTLLDTLEDITDSVNRTLARFGFPPRTIEEIRRFVGNGAVKLLERALPCVLPADTFEAFYRAYDADYTAHREDKTRPYDGASAGCRRRCSRTSRTTSCVRCAHTTFPVFSTLRPARPPIAAQSLRRTEFTTSPMR